MRVLLSLFALGMLLLAGSPLTAQVGEAWVQRFDGPAHVDDGGNAILVDAAGRSWVAGFASIPDGTGSAQAVFLTLRYDIDGTLLWQRTWAPVGGHCRARRLALTPGGDLVVAGFVGTALDWGVIVYDATGVVVWSTIVPTGSLVSTEPRALVVDAAGNVFLCGDSEAGTATALIVKYGPAGNLLWSRTYDGPQHAGANARALVVDGAGNVSVAGSVTVPGRGSDLSLIRYDAAGNLQWTQSIGTPGFAQDSGTCLAIASDGNLVMVGTLGNGSATRSDIVVAKYTPGGTLLWQTVHDEVPGEDDTPIALALDTDGSILVAGSQGLGFVDRDVLLLRFDPQGVLLWSRTLAGEAGQNDAPEALVLDAEGASYMVGYLIEQPGGSRRIFTIKMDAMGELIWQQRYGAGFGSSTGRAVALGPQRRVHVTGSSTATGTGPDVATVVYDQPEFRRGDANGDGAFDLADVIDTLGKLFVGPAANPCPKAADANDDGSVNIADAVFSLTYLFAGGPELPAPFATCGLDPTVDGLACTSHTACP